MKRSSRLIILILIPSLTFLSFSNHNKQTLNSFSSPGDTTLPLKNLIVNGDFESGNKDFKSEYDYITDTLFPGRYTVTDNVNKLNFRLKSPDTGDHTSGKGNYLVVDSKIYRYSIKSKIWISKPVKIKKHTNYIFSAWIFNVGGGGSSSPELTLSIKDKVIGKPFRLTHNSNRWEQMYYQWNSGNHSGKISIAIENNYYYQYIEDFAIDDVVFGMEAK